MFKNYFVNFSFFKYLKEFFFKISLFTILSFFLFWLPQFVNVVQFAKVYPIKVLSLKLESQVKLYS